MILKSPQINIHAKKRSRLWKNGEPQAQKVVITSETCLRRKMARIGGTTKGETTADSRALLECKNDKQVKVKMQRTSWTDCHAEPWAGHGASDWVSPVVGCCSEEEVGQEAHPGPWKAFTGCAQMKTQNVTTSDPFSNLTPVVRCSQIIVVAQTDIPQKGWPACLLTHCWAQSACTREHLQEHHGDERFANTQRRHWAVFSILAAAL